MTVIACFLVRWSYGKNAKAAGIVLPAEWQMPGEHLFENAKESMIMVVTSGRVPPRPSYRLARMISSLTNSYKSCKSAYDPRAFFLHAITRLRTS
jgi:hypothetical protein